MADSIINGTLDIRFFNAHPSKAAFSIEAPATIPRPVSIISSVAPLREKRRLGDATIGYQEGTTQHEVMKKLLSIYGFGKFAAENMMQLLGFFDVYAFDSETARRVS